MASITIPKPAQAGLIRLASLPDETAQELLKALEDVSLVVYGGNLLDQLISSLPTIQRNELQEILATLYGLSAAEVPVERSQFIDDLVSAFARQAKPVSDEQLNNLRERLTTLLGTDAIRIGGKARSVLFENEHNLVGARIVSDIRPIFGDEVQNPPVGAIIVHSLKIEYLSSGKRHEFYVALDTKDVDSLLKVLERAKAKTSSLQSLLGTTSVRYVEAE